MRATRAWSGLAADVWAAELGVSRATVHNYETKKEAPLEILRRAADLVGAPLAFMEGGWDAVTDAPAAPELEARLRALEERATNAA